MAEIHRGIRTKVLVTAIAGLSVLALMVQSFAPQPGEASSHREAPLTAGEPQIDTTDVYAFVSPDAPETVTLVANFIPFEEPAGGPNFYFFQPGVRYHLNIDNDGDAKRDVTYRFVFKNHIRNPQQFLYNTGPVTDLDDPDLNFYQTYSVKRVIGRGKTAQPEMLVKNAMVAPSRVGEASMPDYEALREEATINANDINMFAGQADDPFFLDLRVFDLLYGGDFSEVGDDTLNGFNVNTIALQVPMTDLAKNRNPEDNPVIGVWNTVRRRGTQIRTRDGGTFDKGQYVNVSRLGNPLVNEVVIPLGLKDEFNASRTTEDAKFLPFVQDPILPKVVNAVYGLPIPDSDPDTPGIQRADLIQAFLTGIDGLNQPANVVPAEMLRLNMSIPPCDPQSCETYSRLGVIGGDTAGFPNGRRLSDDVVDIALQVMEGELLDNPNDLGDAVDQNEVPFLSTFPYVALPHSGSNPAPHDSTP